MTMQEVSGVRVLLGQLVHIVVTVGLGQDAGGGNGEVLGVAFDNGGVWNGGAGR